ncbi:hypothetical protein [Mesobacillus jeotgali]|uniref:hypothetical protein n=1 Tax=Mesobacillus jeotgali TaxID=129985 RepID=UPI0009A5C900|nr:hypothetical protein [Mesobacillus jeotgali]
MKYEIYAVIILVIGSIIAILRSYNKSKETKFRVWGSATMLLFAPILSWLVGSLYGVIEGSGFAMIGVLIILFPILFILGFVLYWIGGNEN